MKFDASCGQVGLRQRRRTRTGNDSEVCAHPPGSKFASQALRKPMAELPTALDVVVIEWWKRIGYCSHGACENLFPVWRVTATKEVLGPAWHWWLQSHRRIWLLLKNCRRVFGVWICSLQAWRAGGTLHGSSCHRWMNECEWVTRSASLHKHGIFIMYALFIWMERDYLFWKWMNSTKLKTLDIMRYFIFPPKRKCSI